jgi:hypothetical protein
MQAEDFGASCCERDGDVTVFTPLTQPAPQPKPGPATSPDETFASTLHEWLDSHPKSQKRLQQASEQWLVAKHL